MRQRTGVFISLFTLMLTGCGDMIEIEKQSYVIAVGIDLTEEENLYQFTFQIANPGAGDSSDGNGQVTEENISIPTSDLITATDIANNFVAKKINLDHARVFIISEELARSGELVRIIQQSSQTTHMRRTIQLIVTKENAEVFLNNADPKVESKPHKYYQFMISRANDTGIIPDADFHRFYQLTEAGSELFLAIYATTIQEETDLSKPSIEKKAGELIKKGESPAVFMGSAVFKNGKMIDILNAQETRFTNVLDKTMKMDNFVSSFPDPIKPEYNIAGTFIQEQSFDFTIDYDAKENHAQIKVVVEFDFETIAIPSMIDYSSNAELEGLFKKSIEEHYQSKVEKFIKKTQIEYKSDPFYWSLFFRKFFKDIPSYEEANWHEDVYPNAEVSVEFKLERLEFGKSLYGTSFNELGD